MKVSAIPTMLTVIFVSLYLRSKIGQEELAQIYAQYSKTIKPLWTLRQDMRARDVMATSVLTFSYSWVVTTLECSAIQASLGVLHDISDLAN